MRAGKGAACVGSCLREGGQELLLVQTGPSSVSRAAASECSSLVLGAQSRPRELGQLWLGSVALLGTGSVSLGPSRAGQAVPGEPFVPSPAQAGMCGHSLPLTGTRGAQSSLTRGCGTPRNCPGTQSSS